MPRLNIFLRDRLLDEIDRQAQEEGINRSALIQAAVEKYIEAKQRGPEDEERRKKMQDASRRMDALAKKLGNWDPQATIRKFRDRTSGAVRDLSCELGARSPAMKQKIIIVMDEEIVRLAKERAAKEHRTLSGLVQEALVKHLRKDATPKERKIAYQLFCERPMRVPQKQLRFILTEDIWRL